MSMLYASGKGRSSRRSRSSPSSSSPVLNASNVRLRPCHKGNMAPHALLVGGHGHKCSPKFPVQPVCQLPRQHHTPLKPSHLTK